VNALALGPQRLTARGQNIDARRPLKNLLRQDGRRLDDTLTVVEDEKDALVPL